jgi:hypothetical protein
MRRERKRERGREREKAGEREGGREKRREREKVSQIKSRKGGSRLSEASRVGILKD